MNLVLAHTRKAVIYPKSVLHISNMLRVPYETVHILRRQGMKADYLSVGSSAICRPAQLLQDGSLQSGQHSLPGLRLPASPTAHAYVADQACGVAHHQPVLGHILVTTAPAPTIAQRPIVMPQSIVALAPSAAPSHTRVVLIVQSLPPFSVPSGLTARGCLSFVKTTCGPTKTPSSMVTPSKIET